MLKDAETPIVQTHLVASCIRQEKNGGNNVDPSPIKANAQLKDTKYNVQAAMYISYRPPRKLNCYIR